MKNKRTYYRCEICSNIIGMIEDSSVVPVCCDNEMTLLKANTVDGAEEKPLTIYVYEEAIQ